MRFLSGIPALAIVCAVASAADRPAMASKSLPLYPQARSAEGYAPPLRTAGPDRVSSGFGWRRHPIYGYLHRHQGLDLPKPRGTPVYPSQNGVVTYAGWKRGYGWVVELRHPDGARTVYGHLARFFFVTGQLVHKGMLLGLVGSSGLSTGSHLHFEYRDAAGRAMDPRLLVNSR